MSYHIFNNETGEVVEIKTKPKRMKGRGFAMVDQMNANSLAKMKDLCGTDHRVLWYIISKIDYDNTAIMTQSFIAKELESQQSLVSKSVKKLEQLGYIEKININGANGYKINAEFACKGRNSEK